MDELIDLNRKLTIKEKKYYLGKLLYFEVDDSGVIYDEEGCEFYGYDINDKHELETLKGIIEYCAFIKACSELFSFKLKVKSLFE